MFDDLKNQQNQQDKDKLSGDVPKQGDAGKLERQEPESAPPSQVAPSQQPTQKVPKDDFNQRLEKLREKGEKGKGKKSLYAIIGVIVFSLIGGGAVAGYKYWPQISKTLGIGSEDETVCTLDAKECADGSFVARIPPDCEFAQCPVIEEEEEEVEKEIDISNWQTYQNEEYGFEVKYPLGLRENIDKIITIEMIEEIRERYEEAQKEGGCPGRCGTLAANRDILERQFEILLKTGECPYSDDLKKDIKENFILFQGGLGEIHGVEDIYNDNLKKCGMKLIGYDGYDVMLSNFYYRVGFLIDEKVIKVSFSLFPYNVFEEVDQLWRELGYDLPERSCDASCYEKEVNYYENLDSEDIYFDNKIIESVADKYNQILSTFKFIGPTIADTVDWLTYQNEELGFKFQYPSEWTVAGEDNYLELANSVIALEEIEIFKSSELFAEILDTEMIREGSVYLDNYEVQYELYEESIEDEDDQYYLNVVIPEKDIYYQLDLSQNNLDTLYYSFYNIILSTIEFLDEDELAELDETADEEQLEIDSDEDGLTNEEEDEYGTDPDNPDSDGDGYLDGDEVKNGYNPMGEGKL